MPSSRSWKDRLRLGCCLIRSPSADRNPLIMRASWEAVAVNANCASRVSSTTSTTRVTSRTFEYDSRPSRNSSAILGMRRSALATRTCSRATPGVIEHAHESQCANDLKSFQYRIPFDGVEFPQQLQQVILGPGRIGGCCADPARQPIRPPPLLLIGD